MLLAAGRYQEFYVFFAENAILVRSQFLEERCDPAGNGLSNMEHANSVPIHRWVKIPEQRRWSSGFTVSASRRIPHQRTRAPRRLAANSAMNGMLIFNSCLVALKVRWLCRRTALPTMNRG